jgi:hypothetical protein
MWSKIRVLRTLAIGSFAALSLGGCPSADDIEDIIDELDDIEIEIDNSVDVIQDDDPRFVSLPPTLASRTDVIIIDNSVTIIDNVQDDIIIEELPNSLLIGFENLRGLDGYFRYFANDDIQGIFVFAGETLILEYDCLFDFELVSEEYFNPFDGVLEEAFEYDPGEFFFEEPFDYLCGDFFLFTFTADSVEFGTESVSLID